MGECSFLIAFLIGIVSYLVLIFTKKWHYDYKKTSNCDVFNWTNMNFHDDNDDFETNHNDRKYIQRFHSKRKIKRKKLPPPSPSPAFGKNWWWRWKASDFLMKFSIFYQIFDDFCWRFLSVFFSSRTEDIPLYICLH